MGADDSRSPASDEGLALFRVDVPGDRIDVAKDGVDTMPEQDVGGRNEAEGRDNDLTLKRERPDHQRQRDGSITGDYAVFDTQEVPQALLKLSY